jgi:tRNA A-37 threonylcarbamoyl transferase component Bud32
VTDHRDAPSTEPAPSAAAGERTLVRPRTGRQRAAGPGLAGRYRIDRLLGRGGMGEVYLGWDPDLERPVALKTIRPEIVRDRHWLERFRFEATVCATLQHANVVQVHEIAELAGRPLLVMEYVDGTDLKTLVNGRRLAEAEIAGIMAEVCDALAYAHARGVIHRDIKPGNVMLTRDGTAKVADFGLATQAGRAASARIDAAETGSAIGSPAYMSPEQVEGDLARLDNRTDIYSLGATLYFALTGSAPFAGADDETVLQAVLDGALAPPSHKRPGLDRDLEAVCLKAMAADPDARYATAAAMAQDLRNWARGLPVRARDYGRAEILRRALAARKGVFLASLLAIAVVFSGIAGSALTIHEIAKTDLFEGMRARVMDLANTAVLLVDPDEVAAVIDGSDAAGLAEARLQRRLTQIRARSPDLRYAWIMHRPAATGSALRFVADSLPPPGAPAAETPARAGDRYDAAPYPELLRGLAEPAADRTYSITDRWGIALSGYAPVRDRTGHPIAVLGVDISQRQIARRFAQLDRTLGVALALAGVLSVLALLLVALVIGSRWHRQRLR